jgi:hypothetical protein
MLKKITLLSLIMIFCGTLTGCCTLKCLHKNLYYRCTPRCEQLKCEWYKIVTNRHNEASCVDQQQLQALRQEIICNHCMFEEDYQCKNVYPKVTNPPKFLRECL